MPKQAETLVCVGCEQLPVAAACEAAHALACKFEYTNLR